MPAIKALYNPALWALFGTLSLAPFLTSCGGDGSENHDAGDAVDAPAEDAAEPELDDGTEDPSSDDASVEEIVDDPVPDEEEEELPCPSFSEVQPIFTRICTACHVGYDNYSTITSRIDAVHIRVQGFHHIYGEDRSAVLRWIECGTLP